MAEQSQAELLAWMVEKGSGVFVVTGTWGPDTIIRAPDGERKTIDGADVRELEAKGLIRPGPGKSVEVTNEGRARSGG